MLFVRCASKCHHQPTFNPAPGPPNLYATCLCLLKIEFVQFSKACAACRCSSPESEQWHSRGPFTFSTQARGGGRSVLGI